MIFTDDLPATGLNWKYVWSEILELIEAMRNSNLHGIRNELCDVYTCSMCAITTTTGMPMPILWTRSANGWVKRIEFWKRYLTEIGLEYKLEYVRYGSNYKKAHKRRRVAMLAIEDQILQ